MSTLDAVLLGLLQALGEFLPISSSAHLVLLPFFRGQAYQGVAFDVLLHLATLLAVVLYFAKDWLELFKQGLSHPCSPQGRTLWLLALATVPAGLAGVLFNDQIETLFRHPLLIALCLAAFALLLGWADKRAKTDSSAVMNAKNLLLIGCAQALALMPGVSRSGVTMTAALLIGFSRAESARISFLLSAPIIAGAAVLELMHMQWPADPAPLIWGFASAFAGGLLVIGALMRFLKDHTFTAFVVYRLLLALAIAGWWLHTA